MRLLDIEVCQDILCVTAQILREYFLYSQELLGKFIDVFISKMKAEHAKLERAAYPEIIDFLRYNLINRKDFTSYFVSYHLHDVLVDDFFFSEEELQMFDNILPKFIGVQEHTCKAKA